MKQGFITQDHYAAIPYGKKQLMIIFNGDQLGTVNTELQAKKFIDDHRTKPGIGTVFVDSSSPPVTMKKPRKKQPK
jgi:hypothetical protein